MDISFQTSAGDGAWDLEECAAWAARHDFDCVRLADSGALESNRILTEGPDEVLETLKRHDLYLACITSHCNLLDDSEEMRTAEQSRLIRAIESAARLGVPGRGYRQRCAAEERAVLRNVFLSARQPE